MTADHTISATFGIDSFTIAASSGPNGSVTPPGLTAVTYGGSQAYEITPDDGYHVLDVLIDGDSYGLLTSYEFTNVIENHTIDAYFSINTYTLNVAIVGSGSVTKEPNLSEYDFGAEVMLTATSAAGWTFTGWSEDVNSTENPIVITMDDDKNITATFVSGTYTLNVQVIGNGSVTKEPDLPFYQYQSVVLLRAFPDSSWIFRGWSGDASGMPNPLRIVMNSDKSITAIFVIPSWKQRESIPTHAPKPNKYVKDGGAIVGVSSGKSAGGLYAFRGNRSGEFYKYDSTWTMMASIPYGKKPSDSTKINKKNVGKGGALCYDGVNTIYATKGSGTWEFWAYDVALDTWIQKAFVPAFKSLKGGTSIVFHNGKVYLLAGSQKLGQSNFYVYNPDADTANGSPWTTLPSAPTTPDNKPFKYGSCITELTGTIYALKGGGKYNFFYAYNIADSTWAQKESMPRVHPALGKKNKVKDGGAMTSGYGLIFAIKGGAKNEFWRYSPNVHADTGVWSPDDTIPKGPRGRKGPPRAGASLTFCEDSVFLLKGNNSNEFWRFVPVSFDEVNQSSIAPMLPESNAYHSIMSNKSFVTINEFFNVTPNPFTKYTTIHYSVPVSGKASVKLFNSTGRLIETLIDEYQNAGSYTLELGTWKLKVSKGIYFLRYEDMTNRVEVKVIVE